jgi:hypothetical protein
MLLYSITRVEEEEIYSGLPVGAKVLEIECLTLAKYSEVRKHFNCIVPYVNATRWESPRGRMYHGEIYRNIVGNRFIHIFYEGGYSNF